MWIITKYSSDNKITMFEFNTEKEARAAFEKIAGYKILTEVITLIDKNSYTPVPVFV